MKDIYSDEGFEEIGDLGEFPEDTSIVFFVLKKKATRAVYFNCDGEGADTYRLMFRAMKTYKISKDVLTKVIKIAKMSSLSTTKSSMSGFDMKI